MQTPARRTFPDELAASLRASILSGEYAAGELLPPERELALQLGTNRNTLREALRVLEAQGLLQARHGQGVRVLDFRADGEISLLGPYFDVARTDEQLAILIDLLRYRSVVAREAVARAAESAAPEGVARLEEQLAQLRRAVASGDSGAVVEPELALYRAVIAAGRSLPAMWLFNSLARVIRGFARAYPGLWVTPTGYLEGWQRIVGCVRDGDGEGAEAALVALLAATDEMVLDLLGGALRRAPRQRRRRRP